MSESQPVRVEFDTFELIERDARLTREGRPVPLPPKAFAVLCTLARQPGQLVTKSALLDAVWGHQHVSESVLKTTISELRAALSDDAREPRYIETASRRGYRFICAVQHHSALRSQAAPSTPSAAAVAPRIAVPAMIGRRAALARLHVAWDHAAAGRRQFVWIAGEAGVGKTTLIDTLVGELGEVVCVHGQCVGQFGAGEPYLPVLEALGALTRKDPALAALMRAVAPSWLLHLPWLIGEAERETLRRDLMGSSPERMLRELAELLDRYTERNPLLLVTEDLHWSDNATVRLIDHIARRRGAARLLWIGSFRVAELVSEDHPLKALRHELRVQRLCDEIVLDPFSEQEVADYVDSRFPGSDLSEAFVRRLHTHTDGLPLFVVNVIDDLVSQGAMRDAAQSMLDPTAAWQVPENLAGVMEKQIARLPAEVCAVLEAASVCGVEFRPRIVAEALQRDAEWVRSRCDELVRQQYWIRHVAIDNLADGSLDARYGFRHALYRHVLHQRMPALARAQMHRTVGVVMERARSAGLAVTSAELASHFDLGQDPLSALRHYADAADSALAHFGPMEAVNLTAQAVKLLPRCPEGLPRLQLELKLLTKRGVACLQIMGMVSAEAKAAFERAQAICDVLPETPALGWALSGLAWIRYGQGEYATALALAERIRALAGSHDDRVLLVSACNLAGLSIEMQGDHDTARQWFEQGIALCDELGDQLPYLPFPVHPAVSMRSNLSLLLMHLGLVDQAQQHRDRAIAQASAVGQPLAKVMALRCSAQLEARLSHPEPVAQLAVSLGKLAAEHALIQAQVSSIGLAGWAQAHLGHAAAGYAKVLEAFDIITRVGLGAGFTQVLCYAAEVAILAAEWAAAQKHVEDALEVAARLQERVRIPDLLVAQARIALARGRTDAGRASLHASLEEARAQHALGFELAALVLLCELAGATAADRGALADAYGRVTEGLDTALVLRARELLNK